MPRPNANALLSEGIQAFAAQRAAQEVMRANALEVQWAPLRKVAGDLLAGLLVSDIVEIEVDEEQEEVEESCEDDIE